MTILRVCRIATIFVALAACGGNKGQGTDGGGTTDGGAQTPGQGTVTGNVTASIANAEVILLAPGAASPAYFTLTSYQGSGLTFSQPGDAQNGSLTAAIGLPSLDGGVYSISTTGACGGISFFFSSGGSNACYGTATAINCGGGKQPPSGSWTLTLTSVGPPTPNGTTGGYLYSVNGTLTGTLVDCSSAATLQANLSF